MQVVRTGPNVDKNQRPEVNDAQLVTKHRPIGSLGQKVIHQSQKRHGQKERHKVMTIPPLHQRVLNTRIDRVAFAQPHRDDQAVEHMQQRHGDNRRDVEPQRHIHVPLSTMDQSHHEVGSEEQQPNNSDGDIDRPLKLRVLFALGNPKWKRQGRCENDPLPTPKMKPTQGIGPHPSFAQSLGAVVDGSENRVASKSEYRGIGVQWPKPCKRQHRPELTLEFPRKIREH